MRKLNVDVREDSARPGGGHAIIRFIGLESLPDSVTYRIKSVEGGSGRENGGGWVDTERAPLATRMTEDGAELVVGPEIVENPHLLPGTLAVIEIAKCGVRGELLWPRIAPVQRPKRRHLIGMKPQREAPSAPPRPSQDIVFGEATDASSSIDPAPAPVVVPFVAPAVVVARNAAEPETGSAAANPALATVTEGKQAEPVCEAPTVPAAAVSKPAEPVDQLEPKPATPVARDIAWSGSREARSSSWLRVALAAGAGAVGVLGLAHLLPSQSGPARTPLPVTAQVSDTARSTPALLAGLFSVGPTSPRGTDVSRLSQQRLLEEADARLHGDAGQRDKAEAEFLLRRFIGTSLGEERTIWALTQLGSIYAEPGDGRTPDYGKARELWQVASSLGDGVAMCFLGSLHEHGVGVKPDRGEALRWFLKAKDAGGCAGAVDAVERLKASR